MLHIIQGNDAVVSVILHQQVIHLGQTPVDTSTESRKVDLTAVRELSVRLMPYMRWAEVTPEFAVRDNVLEVAFPASLQRPGKWDIEIAYLAPADGGYQRQRLKQAFAEVLPAYSPQLGTTTTAQVLTAEVTQALRGAAGQDAYHYALDQGLVSSEEEWLERMRGPQGNEGKQGDPGTPGLPGKSAYQSYLDTYTGDTPLSERDWAANNDYLYNLLMRLLYGNRPHPTSR